MSRRAEDRAVGRERQPVDLRAVGGQAEQLLTGERVPQSDHPFDPRGGQCLAVRSERELAELVAFAVDDPDEA